MKKIFTLMTLMMLAAISVKAQNKMIIAYFSWGGNTRALANEIQNQTGADIYRIEPAEPYSTDYQTTAYGRAYEEYQNDSRPALADTTHDFSPYSYIFIGCPVWWMTTPKLIDTFLETYDFSGKTVIPFTTYYSGTYSCLTNIVNKTPNSNHLEGFGTNGTNNQSSYTAAVTSWLQRIGIADLVTSIDKVNVDNSKRSMAIYTLDGKAMGNDVTTLAAGTYIRNGRKFMVR